MASPQGSARYHLLIRPSEDLAGDESPVASLLPRFRSSHRQAKTYTFSLNLSLSLRFLTNVAAITAFIIFVVDSVHARHTWWYRGGSGDYIAAAVFLGMLFVHNFLMVIHQLVANTFRITIEFRNQGWSPIREGRKKPKIGMYLDLGLASCLALSLIIGNSVGKHSFNAGRIVAVVFAYLAVLLQAFVAIPALDERSLTVKLEPKSVEAEEVVPPRGDIKLPISEDEIEEVARHGSPSMHGARPSDVDEPRQSAEQLV